MSSKKFLPRKTQNRRIENFKFQIPMNDPNARYPFSVRFHHGGWCMRGGDFVGSMLWGFKFQIEIGDVDFETGIWAETYHN